MIKSRHCFLIIILIIYLTFAAAAQGPTELIGTKMVTIPAGSYLRADGKEIKVSTFSIAATEVNRGLWDTVWDWANQNGYDITPGRSEEANRPIWTVNWYDCVKWCNALSEMQGLTPVYYTDSKKESVYRQGEINLANDMVKWDAGGFRLPTEAEWEYAYRAGTVTNYYWGQGDFTIWEPDDAPWRKYTQTYLFHLISIPQPVGQKLPNKWGLYDMAGNADEWCWDRYQLEYPGEVDNPRGSLQGRLRVLRGGSTALDSQYYQQAFYRGRTVPYYRFNNIGFRLAGSKPGITVTVSPSPAPSHKLRVARDVLRFGSIPNDAKSAAKRFLRHVNLDTAGLEKVKAFYSQGRYQQALDEYRDWFFSKHRDNDIQLKRLYLKMDFDVDDLMKLTPPLIYYHNEPLYYNQPSTYRVGELFIAKYQQTGDFKYIKKYFELTTDFALNGRRQYFELDDIGLGKHYMGPRFDSHWPQHWEFGEGLDSARRSRAMANQLYILCKTVPVEEVKNVPSISLANELTFIVEALISGGLANGKECVPNQVKHIASDFVKFGRNWEEFKDAASW